jgi:hypothetical protein
MAGGRVARFGHPCLFPDFIWINLPPVASFRQHPWNNQPGDTQDLQSESDHVARWFADELKAIWFIGMNKKASLGFSQ